MRFKHLFVKTYVKTTTTVTFVVPKLDVLKLPLHDSGGVEVWGGLANLGISRRHGGQ